MKLFLLLTFYVPVFCLFLTTFSFGQNPQLNRVQEAPLQDQGLPYTRSSKAAALAKIKDQIAVFAGSRLGYVKGYRVRLNPHEIIHGAEAILRKGIVYVPISFASVLALNEIKSDDAPDYLASRWIYTIQRPKVIIPKNVPTIEFHNQPYVAIAEYAKYLGLKVYQSPHGLVLMGKNEIGFSEAEKVLLDAVITLFDTPEKFADPDLPIKYIPRLKEQGKWTEHVRLDPGLLKMLGGEETVWEETPRSQYDLTGFNAKLLGSKVPPPGIYPRLLFSPEDLPMFRDRISENKTMQMSLVEMKVLFEKSWWNPKTEDGQAFLKLASGIFSVPKGNIYNSHVNYPTNCLTSMALYSLLTNDNEHGKQAARALVTYYKNLESDLDQLLAKSDSEFGTSAENANFAETQWRGMHGFISHMDLAFALDLAGYWMNSGEKDVMRRIIAKATYGRRNNAGDGPRRAWRDINHMTWHQTHFLAVTVIEGLEGFDPEGYASGAELTHDFLEWGIDQNGQMFESNGKSGGGLRFQVLSMIALARRGDNLWGHPHWRKLLTANVYTTSPNGKAVISPGTFSGTPLAFDTINLIKAFYPQEKAADYLLTTQFPDLNLKNIDVAEYSKKLQKDSARQRLPGLTYPSFTRTVLYDTDWEQINRAELKLPADWNDPVHGMFSASNSSSPDAAWLALNVRPNHYIGSGHHHADGGMFYFSALGVNWITESPFSKTYDGKYHNQVLIDGISEANGPPSKADYLGATLKPGAAFASADLTYAYSWRWNTQVEYWDSNNFTKEKEDGKTVWEIEPNPEIIKIFKGTDRYKFRVWWATYNFANWLPTLRAPWNPVQYVYRSTGLVRGENPYSVVIDDVKKDDQTHLYQWTAMLGTGVWKADYPNLPKNQIVLSRAEISPKPTMERKPLPLKNGDQMLLVAALDPNGSGDKLLPLLKVETLNDGPNDSNGGIYDRLTVNLRGTQSNFKVLLIPFHYGEQLPKISFEAGKNRCEIVWKNQRDELVFTKNKSNRTLIKVNRHGKEVISLK